MAGMELGRTIYDEGWDLFGYTGYAPEMDAIIVAFKGTDSHSIYNWAENMHYWKTEYQVPYPGSEGASVHTGGPSFFLMSPEKKNDSGVMWLREGLRGVLSHR